LRYEPRGSFFIEAMSHKHNLTVPGVVGYRPQKSGGSMPVNPEETIAGSGYDGTGGTNTGGSSYPFNPIEIPGDHH